MIDRERNVPDYTREYGDATFFAIRRENERIAEAAHKERQLVAQARGILTDFIDRNQDDTTIQPAVAVAQALYSELDSRVFIAGRTDQEALFTTMTLDIGCRYGGFVIVGPTFDEVCQTSPRLTEYQFLLNLAYARLDFDPTSPLGPAQSKKDLVVAFYPVYQAIPANELST